MSTSASEPHRSRFVSTPSEDGSSPVAISAACYAFEQYLVDDDYEAAVEVCPWAEGQYVGAEDAYDLVDDFLGEHPEYSTCHDELIAHAGEIGQVSNAFADRPGDDDDVLGEGVYDGYDEEA